MFEWWQAMGIEVEWTDSSDRLLDLTFRRFPGSRDVDEPTDDDELESLSSVPPLKQISQLILSRPVSSSRLVSSLPLPHVLLKPESPSSHPILALSSSSHEFQSFSLSLKLLMEMISQIEYILVFYNEQSSLCNKSEYLLL
jgi:hypothetical protein